MSRQTTATTAMTVIKDLAAGGMLSLRPASATKASRMRTIISAALLAARLAVSSELETDPERRTNADDAPPAAASIMMRRQDLASSDARRGLGLGEHFGAACVLLSSSGTVHVASRRGGFLAAAQAAEERDDSVPRYAAACSSFSKVQAAAEHVASFAGPRRYAVTA
jgi:hypothetical protein